MTRPVRWGVLSTARINRLLLAGARKSDRVDVVAVASRDQARADAFAREHDIARAHGSYETLLEDPEVEAVYIPLPNALHVEWSLRALEAGKHVLCEKPLTRRPQEVEEVFRAAERADLLVMEAFMYRHHPQTRRLEQLVDNGAIGELRVVRSAFSFPLTRLDDVRMIRELDGGSLMDVGCYCVSGTRFLAGEPQALEGEQVLGSSGVDVRFAGAMRFPGEVLAHFDCGFDLPDRSVLEAIGSEGSLTVADPWHCRQPGIELRRDGEREQIVVEPADSYQLELENLSDAIRGHAVPLLGRDDSLGQARALEALYEAAGR
jgi:D-xylose 1-dehydrogenase (NADP+, D-xylono-1,5-lactone-forming)